MPYNCQQNLFHYYSDSPFTPRSCFNKSPTIPTATQHHHEQHGNMSPAKFSLPPGTFSLSPAKLTSSPVSFSSSPLYDSNMVLSAKGASSFTEAFFVQNDGENEGNQPLDLRIRTGRDEETLKRAHVEEQNPICMVKSCTCNNSNHLPKHLSLYPIAGQGVARSPNSGMTASPLNCTESSFSNQHQIANFTSNGGFSNSTAPLLCYLPQPSPWTTTDNSSFPHLASSNNLLNCDHNQSSLFRPYDDHVGRDNNVRSPKDAHQPASLLPLPKQHKFNDDDDDNDDDEPTYVDLDSATTKPVNINPRKDVIGNLNIIYGKPNISLNISPPQYKIPDGQIGAIHSPRRCTLVQAMNNRTDLYSTDQNKTAACFVGGVISHTSLEKSKKIVSRSASVSPNSEHATEEKHHPQKQMYFPHSLSPQSGIASPTGPSGVASPAGHSTCYSAKPNTHPATTFHSQLTNGHSNSSGAADDLPYSVSPLSDQQSPSAGHFHADKLGRKSPLDKRSISGNKNRNIKLTSSTASSGFELSTNTNVVTGNKYRRTEAHQDISSVHQASSQLEDNEKSTKISLLDFWISKILMERSSETPQARKPCNVDYICTANGEKRVRLRLVDLMELQVEQSLKA